MPSPASFEAPYSEVCNGKGASSGVGNTSGSPYTEPVEEKPILVTPSARIASSTFEVAIVFCSRSRRGCSSPWRTSAFACRWKTQSHPETASRIRSASSTSPSNSFVPGRSSSPATNSRRPVRKSSTTLTSTPSALSRSARVLPMNPPPPVTQARFTRSPSLPPGLSRAQREAGGGCVAVEHLHGLQRVFVEVVPEQGELL